MGILLSVIFFMLVGGGVAIALDENIPKDFNKFDSLFKKWGATYGIDWKWLKAISWNESTIGNNSRVKNGEVSFDGLSWGLMQITIPTAGDFIDKPTPEKLNDVNTSVKIAAQLLRRLKIQFGSHDIEGTIRAYNRGARGVKLWRQGDPRFPDNKINDDYWIDFQSRVATIFDLDERKKT